MTDKALQRSELVHVALLAVLIPGYDLDMLLVPPWPKEGALLARPLGKACT